LDSGTGHRTDTGGSGDAPRCDSSHGAYACDLSLTFLAGFRADPARRTFDALAQDFLEVKSV
jgi:hypothetical protein